MAKGKLYYTTNGVDPTNGSTPYSGSFAVNNGVNVKAVAYLGTWASLISSETCVISIPSPTILVGNVGSVSFTRINGDCYYTINGSTPTTASTKYTGGSIPVNNGTVVKAICVYRGGTSPVATETVTYTLPTPSISIGKTGAVTVTKGLGDSSGSVLRYTTNGSSPTTSSPVFSSLTATNGQNIKVASFYGGTKSSDASAWYYDAPTISVGSTTTILGATGAMIRYTTNGSEPNDGSPLYTGALTFSASTTIKAIQILNGFTSATRTAQFVAMPTIRFYDNDLGKATIHFSGSGSIRYTIDGTDPRTSSTAQTVGKGVKFLVVMDRTVKATVVLNGAYSGVTSKVYKMLVKYVTITTPVQSKVPVVYANFEQITKYTTDGNTPYDDSSTLNSGTAYDSGEMRVRTKDVNTGEWLHEGFFYNTSSNSINWNANITEVKAINSLADEIEIQLTPRATGATYLYRSDHGTPVRPNFTNSIVYKSDKPFSFRIPSGDTLSWLAIGSNGIGGAVYSFSGRCTVEI
ncbi:hypothetical protein BV741P2_00043 [Phocaeicola phage BV741P2]|nr:hypothetical protein BV741P2_00043 [Phocaeicola phage BV741P2]